MLRSETLSGSRLRSQLLLQIRNDLFQGFPCCRAANTGGPFLVIMTPFDQKFFHIPLPLQTAFSSLCRTVISCFMIKVTVSTTSRISGYLMA